MSFQTINNNGELKVRNRSAADGTVFYDPDAGIFKRLEPVTVHGVVTEQWVPADPPTKFFNPVDGKYYSFIGTSVHGVMTGQWVEVT